MICLINFVSFYCRVATGECRVASSVYKKRTHIKENRIQTSDGINPYPPVMEIEESNVHFILNSS